MISYNDYELNDLLESKSFRDWVFLQQPEDTIFWQNWLKDYPQKIEMVDEAKTILLAIRGEQEFISDERVEQKVSEIIGMTAEQNKEERPVFSLLRQVSWLKIAASITIILGSLSWYFIRNNNSENVQVTTYQEMTKPFKSTLIEEVNAGNLKKIITLSDGSTIILQKNSRISYPENFTGNKREVFLSGEAFFEISKDPSKPFFVYANELVTKVLGTSFTVRAFDKEKEVTVVVRTGKVSVFAQKDKTSEVLKNNRELTGLVLSPNQQAVYARDEIRLVRSLIEKPALIEMPSASQEFEFRRTEIAKVFETLEKMYGIEIVFDEETMAKCTITASMGDEPLHEKMKMICAATESTYEVIDGQIVVSSRGCR